MKETFFQLAVRAAGSFLAMLSLLAAFTTGGAVMYVTYLEDGGAEPLHEWEEEAEAAEAEADAAAAAAAVSWDYEEVPESPDPTPAQRRAWETGFLRGSGSAPTEEEWDWYVLEDSAVGGWDPTLRLTLEGWEEEGLTWSAYVDHVNRVDQSRQRLSE